jgi:hypothetical protein
VNVQRWKEQASAAEESRCGRNAAEKKQDFTTGGTHLEAQGKEDAERK